MTGKIDQMRKGTTVVAVLRLLADFEDALHGYEIIQRLEKRSGGYFRFRQGLIYPTLHRMEDRGFVKGRWLGEPGTRRRKVYAITENGRRQLEVELREWEAFRHGMSLLLGLDKVHT